VSECRPILLVEDDLIDALTFKRAFDELGIIAWFVHVTNGEEALDYLQDEDNQPPSIIFLDLNAPRMNGLEFLEIIKGDKRLKKIPVIILTTSKAREDIVSSFGLNAAGYIVKTADYKEFVKTIGAISEYWSLSKVPV